MKNLLKSIVIFSIAYFSLKYLFFLGIVYALVVTTLKKQESNEPNFSEYLWRLAASIDQTLNACLLFLLNDTMRAPNGTNYGNIDETISGVTGKNELSNSLTWFGKLINWLLSKIEKNHSVNAIELDE